MLTSKRLIFRVIVMKRGLSDTFNWPVYLLDSFKGEDFDFRIFDLSYAVRLVFTHRTKNRKLKLAPPLNIYQTITHT